MKDILKLHRKVSDQLAGAERRQYEAVQTITSIEERVATLKDQVKTRKELHNDLVRAQDKLRHSKEDMAEVISGSEVQRVKQKLRRVEMVYERYLDVGYDASVSQAVDELAKED